MEITSSTTLKLISVVYSLTQESPLRRVSKNELKAAVREVNNLKCWDNQRECLLGVLGHLESAYSQFEPGNILAVIFGGEDAMLWDQRTYKNSICMTIAIIHYVLGNVDCAKVWLTEELSDKGWVEMPDCSLELLGFNKIEDFFNAIYHDHGRTYHQLKGSIDYNNGWANKEETDGPGTGGSLDFF